MKSLSVVVIGTIGAPFGVQGWLHVKSYTTPSHNILAYRPWQLKRGGQWRMVEAEARAHRDGFIARLDHVADRDAAAHLAGAEIGVDSAMLPEPDTDEYYWRDLIGLNVRNLAGERLGEVSRLLPTPAHDVLVVVDAGGELLIPFVGNAVVEVDTAAGWLVVDWQRDWH